MEQSSKYKSLVGIIIFLLISNIAILVFFLFLDHGRRPSRGSEQHNAMVNFLQKDIGFDKQQMDDYQRLKDSNKVKIRPHFEELKEAKDSFYNLLYNELPDSTVNKVAAVIGEREIEVDMQLFLYFKTIRKLCTPAQLPKFDSLFTKNVVEKITGSGRFRRQEYNHDKKEK